MKAKFSPYIFCTTLFIMCLTGCSPNSDSVNPNEFCKKITIDDDGDTFSYEFDGAGKLLSIEGQSVADYYTKNAFEVKEQLGDQTVTLLAFKDNLWRQKIVDATGDGFRIYYGPEVIDGETKITRKSILGAAEGDDSFRDEVQFSYGPDGNCHGEYGNIKLDGVPMLYHETTYKYATDKVSPFWKHPFQFFLEMPWAEGRTNKNLPQSAYFYVVNFYPGSDNIFFRNDEEYRIERWGDIDYTYSYDSKGRLSSIRIDKIENEKTTHLPTNNVRHDKKKTQKTISLIYEC